MWRIGAVSVPWNSGNELDNYQYVQQPQLVNEREHGSGRTQPYQEIDRFEHGK